MAKKMIIIVVLYLISGCTSTPKPSDCSTYKIGKFSYYAEESGNSYLIERNDSIQTEKNLTTGSITTLRINWTAPCEYELRYISRQSTPNDSLMSIATTSVLKTKIIEVGTHYCVFSSQAQSIDRVLTDTLKLLEQ
jgi:hypothetical protein